MEILFQWLSEWPLATLIPFLAAIAAILIWLFGNNWFGRAWSALFGGGDGEARAIEPVNTSQSGQLSFEVQCSGCGEKVVVAGPRIGKSPKRVYCEDKYEFQHRSRTYKDSPLIDIVVIKCSTQDRLCATGRNLAIFEY